ncbi:MAG: hypothetical protein ACFFAS_09755 [Promethearchaeota archaeon]
MYENIVKFEIQNSKKENLITFSIVMGTLVVTTLTFILLKTLLFPDISDVIFFAAIIITIIIVLILLGGIMILESYNKKKYATKTKIKRKTKYTTIENGSETFEVKKYTTGPYVEFENEENSTLRVSFFYNTVANISLYIGILILLMINVIFIALFTQINNNSFLTIPALLVTQILINFFVFLTAFMVRYFMRRLSRQFVFNKRTDTFTKYRMKSKLKLKKVFETNLSNIECVDIKTRVFGDEEEGITRYWINLKFKDGSKKKFYSTDIRDNAQFRDYTKWICRFLNVSHRFANKRAVKVFSPFGL